MFIPIVTPTYWRYEKYCDVALALMDSMWPGHPRVWFIADGQGIKYDKKICIDSTSWTVRLKKGLERLKELYPEIEYLYLIIEDLYPLWPCSVKQILEIQKLVLNNKMNYVSFPTYDWGGKETVEIDGITLYKMILKSHPYYSQLQPAIWKFSHLMETCDYALKNDIQDCWSFEFIAISDDHYVARYQWPSIISGFLICDGVNWRAIGKIKSKEGARLRQMLIRNYLSECFFRLQRKTKNVLLNLTGK